MNKTTNIFILTLTALVLVGCSGLGETLGYGKKRPDEFNVLTNPPLVLPPDFNLRPPGKGNRPTTLQGRDLARALVLPRESANTDALSPAEKNLLDKASDGKPYGDGIREQIENDRRGTSSRPANEVAKLVAAANARPQNTKKPDPNAGCRFILCF